MGWSFNATQPQSNTAVVSNMTGNNAIQLTSSVGATPSITIGPFAISTPGYEVGFSVLGKTGSGGTTPTCTIDMVWTDSISGQIISHESWTVWESQAGGGAKYYGTGPTKGNVLTITFSNNDNSIGQTINFVVTQNGNAYNRDDWRTNGLASVPGFTSPNSNTFSNILMQTAPNVGASNFTARPIPLFAGRVTFNTQWTATGYFQVITEDPGMLGNVLYQGNSAAANTPGFVTVALPRSVCYVVLNNNFSSSQQMGFTITIEEYLP